MSASGLRETVPFELAGVPRTLLIPLLARARPGKLDPRVVFKDPWAERWLARLHGAHESIDRLEGERWMLEACLSRAKKMDDRSLAFLRSHDPDRSLVITLGAGLCSRPQRISAAMPEAANADWIEVDFPEVIAVKSALLAGEKGLPRPALLSTSITTPGFLAPALASDPAKGPAALVIIEGVLIYLKPAEVREVIEDVGRTLLARGVSEIRFLFDVAHPMLLASSWRPSFLRQQKAWFQWTVKDPRKLDREIPGLHPILIENLASHSGAAVKRWGARLIEATGVHPYALVEAEWRPAGK
jgi:O-methyltransferase involved in polyketide biosynthesis